MYSVGKNGKKFYISVRSKMTKIIKYITSNMVTGGQYINHSAEKSIHYKGL
jgi:hypothetical protein